MPDELLTEQQVLELTGETLAGLQVAMSVGRLPKPARTHRMDGTHTDGRKRWVWHPQWRRIQVEEAMHRFRIQAAAIAKPAPSAP